MTDSEKSFRDMLVFGIGWLSYERLNGVIETKYIPLSEVLKPLAPKEKDL